jgi:hypothetical protein
MGLDAPTASMGGSADVQRYLSLAQLKPRRRAMAPNPQEAQTAFWRW